VVWASTAQKEKLSPARVGGCMAEGRRPSFDSGSAGWRTRQALSIHAPPCVQLPVGTLCLPRGRHREGKARHTVGASHVLLEPEPDSSPFTSPHLSPSGSHVFPEKHRTRISCVCLQRGAAKCAHLGQKCYFKSEL
jgi:hypothetical protein